jgi:hypothetical protein
MAHARECVRLAGLTGDQEIRNQLLELAREWRDTRVVERYSGSSVAQRNRLSLRVVEDLCRDHDARRDQALARPLPTPASSTMSWWRRLSSTTLAPWRSSPIRRPRHDEVLIAGDTMLSPSAVQISTRKVK